MNSEEFNLQYQFNIKEESRIYHKKYFKKYYADNKEYFKQYHIDNKEKSKQRYIDNKEKLRQKYIYNKKNSKVNNSFIILTKKHYCQCCNECFLTRRLINDHLMTDRHIITHSTYDYKADSIAEIEADLKYDEFIYESLLSVRF
jgi:hypothetical protein